MDITSFSEQKRFTPFFAGDRFSHAYIISGPAGSGADALADTLAAAAVCSGDGKKPCGVCRHCHKAKNGVHPDIIVTDFLPDKSEILVDQIRTLRSDAIVLPNEAERKVYIIRKAGSMNANAQNALLKVLEEPPKYAVFILVAENPLELLPTVRSRCVGITLSPPEDEIAPEGLETANALFAAMEKGQAALTELSFTLDKLSRNEFAEFLSAARFVCTKKLRDASIRGDGNLTAGALNRAERVLSRAAEMTEYNVGVVHIAGYLCAALNGDDKKHD